MTLVVLIGTTTLGLVMTVYLISLATRRRFVIACSSLALAFALMSVSAFLLSLHLAYDIPGLLQLRAILGLVAVPSLYLHFSASRSEHFGLSTRHLIHGLPAFAGALLVLSNLQWLLDFVLLATYLAYTFALFCIWKDREAHFAGLGTNAEKTVIWLLIVILFLTTILVLDLLIFAELAGGGFLEKSAPLLFSVLALIALVSSALIGALGRPSLFEHLYNLSVEVEISVKPRTQTVPDRGQTDLAERALQSLTDPTLLANDSLTVTRLARKLGVPARHLSQAINGVHKCSFSDLLNDQRIRLSQGIMKADTAKPLLEVMMDAGYVTKSNFYRQFSKRTGLTPAAYRAKLKRDAKC